MTGFSLVKEKSYNVLKEALENAKKNYSDVRKVLSLLTHTSGLPRSCNLGRQENRFVATQVTAT